MQRRRGEKSKKMDFTYFFWNSKVFLEMEEQGTKLGFDLYDLGHLLWLAVIGAAIVGITLFYRGGIPRGRNSRKQRRRMAFLRSNAVDVPVGKMLPDLTKRRKRMRWIFAAVAVLSELYRDIVLVATGYFSAAYLPFHLCSFGIFTIVIDAAAEKQKVTGQLMAYAFVPGAISALLFCNWTEYPYLNFMCIHSFFIHGWIACYGIMRIAAGEIRPDYRGVWQSVLTIFLLTPPLYLFNSKFGTNFMFLNEASEGSPLMPVWNILGTRFGEAGYLAGCAGLVIAVFHALWLVYLLCCGGMDRKE